LKRGVGLAVGVAVGVVVAVDVAVAGSAITGVGVGVDVLVAVAVGVSVAVAVGVTVGVSVAVGVAVGVVVGVTVDVGVGMKKVTTCSAPLSRSARMRNNPAKPSTITRLSAVHLIYGHSGTRNARKLDRRSAPQLAQVRWVPGFSRPQTVQRTLPVRAGRK
jgi:hypothetical protein